MVSAATKDTRECICQEDSAVGCSTGRSMFGGTSDQWDAGFFTQLGAGFMETWMREHLVSPA